MLIRKLFIVILILLVPAASWSATYYVRSDGTAADKGSAGGPCATQSAAMDLSTYNGESFTAGSDTVVFCDDVASGEPIYDGQITIKNGITLENESGGSPCVTNGSTKPGSWTNESGNLYYIEDDAAGIVGVTLGGCASPVVGIKVGSKAAVDANNEWYYDTSYSPDRLYVYSTSDPATRYTRYYAAGSSKGMQAAGDAIDNWTVDGIDIIAVSGQAVDQYSGEGWTLKNFSVYGTGSHGLDVRFFDSATITNVNVYGPSRDTLIYGIKAQPEDAGTVTITDTTVTGYLRCVSVVGDGPADRISGTSTITNVTTYDCGDGQYHIYVDNMAISQCTSYDNGIAGGYFTPVGSGGSAEGYGIGLEEVGSSYVEKSLLYDNGNDGIELSNDAGGEATNNNEFRYNKIYGNGDSGFSGYDRSAIKLSSGVTSSGNKIYGNVFYDNTDHGVWANSYHSPEFYNNTFDNHPDHILAGGGLTIKNNIFSNKTDSYFVNHTGSGLTAENNHYDSSAGTSWVGNNTSYTWANWQSAGFDDFSPTPADPAFTNESGDDFTLTSSSPAVDAGESLAASYDDNLDPNSTWTGSVTTLDQDLYGSAWEIGAYVFEEIAVTVTASDATATEESTTTGEYTISCSPDCDSTAVNFSMSGTAIEGADADYTLDQSSPYTITGASATITLTPVDDAVAEGTEEAKIEITSGTGYSVGSPSTAQIDITDNESTSAGVVVNAGAGDMVTNPNAGDMLVP